MQKKIKKKCSKCGKENDIFGSYCRECKNKASKERYERKKLEPEFMAKVKEMSKRYRDNNKEKVAQKAKAKRQTPEFKAWAKEYGKKNRKKLYEQTKASTKKSQIRQRDELTEAYICGRARRKKGDFPPEYIELKRLEITAIRLLRDEGK